jgi:hypothetical protein
VLIGCSFIDTGICINAPIIIWRIIGCRFIDSDYGMNLIKQSNVIDGCEFSNMSVAAITLSPSTSWNNVISNNIFRSNKLDIKCYDTQELTIQGNAFRYSKTYSIDLSGLGPSCTINISGNTFVNASDQTAGGNPVIYFNPKRIYASIINGNTFRNTDSNHASKAVFMESGIETVEDCLLCNNIAYNLRDENVYLIKEGVTASNNIGRVYVIP